MSMTGTLSIVIPALNERHNLAAVLDTVPVRSLDRLGWSCDLIIVDNGSTDGTGVLAKSLGARVVEEPIRGYGNAYRSGLNSAIGEVIATGDADRTYPFDALPALLWTLLQGGYDFLSTNRLQAENRPAMRSSHVLANHALSIVGRTLLRTPFHDSQSGMWLFRREVWHGVDVRSTGMAFSQEFKNEAYFKGFRCVEVPIEYRPRAGDVKLEATRDGLKNLGQLARHRARYGLHLPQPARLGAVHDEGPVRRPT
jgi:glycosyltransferase involved in cell wall biosynthesis